MLKAMGKKLLFFLLIPVIGISQVQIGQDIVGAGSKDHCGYSVALSSYGNVVAVGAPLNNGNGVDSGHVRIYEEIFGDWTQIGQTLEGEFSGDQNGFSVALSSFGNIVAIGSPFNDGNGTNSGTVRVYEFDMGVWKQKGHDIDGKSAGDQNGFSVSLSSNGNIVAIGAPYKPWQGDPHNPAGTVRVYSYSNVSGVWTQIGQDIDGQGFMYYSGTSISLSSDGSILAIGTIYELGTGVVRVYRNISGVWTQIGNTVQGEGVPDRFGRSVSLSSDGSVLAVGGYLNDYKGLNAGHVRVYKNVSGNWVQIGDDIDGEAAHDNSGFSVSLSADGNIVAIGAFLSSSNGDRSGTVRVYENISGDWTKIFDDIDGKKNGEYIGYNVSLSADGNRVAIGAPQFPVVAIGEGLARVYELQKSTNNIFVKNNFHLYPNPASDILNIRLESNFTLEKVTVYNNLGQMIKTTKETVVNVENLSPGIYFVEVLTDQGKGTKKVIIK
ncbi:MAG TPA: T9SS type A sorting domain-containing protein [Flavobacterium sp.]|nr:T9SS type A sorting domain-containing protein [Flavobacterium sp.]